MTTMFTTYAYKPPCKREKRERERGEGRGGEERGEEDPRPRETEQIAARNFQRDRKSRGQAPYV